MFAPWHYSYSWSLVTFAFHVLYFRNTKPPQSGHVWFAGGISCGLGNVPLLGLFHLPWPPRCSCPRGCWGWRGCPGAQGLRGAEASLAELRDLLNKKNGVFITPMCQMYLHPSALPALHRLHELFSARDGSLGVLQWIQCLWGLHFMRTGLF